MDGENTIDNVNSSNVNDTFTLKVIAKDISGNTTSKTVIVDMTAAKKNAVNINVNGYKNTVNEQYATNGNKISAYISINEELRIKKEMLKRMNKSITLHY